MSFRYRVVDINLQSVEESREHVSYGPWHEDMKYPKCLQRFLIQKVETHGFKPLRMNGIPLMAENWINRRKVLVELRKIRSEYVKFVR